MDIFSLFERPLKQNALLDNRFHIHHVIGKGSYGLTYKATNLENGQPVVVKQLRNRKKNKAGELFFFQQEAWFLKQLAHPAIPQFIHSFETAGCPFLVMEFKQAPTFEELIFQQNQQYNERQTFSIALEILSVVQYIHQQGIVHRDLRIPNILWDGCHISIIDFGLARFLREPAGQPVRKEKKALTPFREIHVKSDFFALGHFVLFLLYSAFTPSSKKKGTWETELSLSNGTAYVIRRMLQLEEPYTAAGELRKDIEYLLVSYL